jgi:hypothetical protein
MANLSRYEQEVIINFSAADDVVELYAADPVWVRKLDKLAEQNPGQFKVGRSEQCEGTVIAKRYTFPKRFITIRSKDVKRELTDEQREKLSERMKEMHQNQF